MVHQCVVRGCKYVRNKMNAPVRTFPFPYFGDVKLKWVEAVGRKNFKPSKYSRVCIRHFKEEDFAVTPNKRLKLHQLTLTAVPSLFLPNKTPCCAAHPVLLSPCQPSLPIAQPENLKLQLTLSAVPSLFITRFQPSLSVQQPENPNLHQLSTITVPSGSLSSFQPSLAIQQPENPKLHQLSTITVRSGSLSSFQQLLPIQQPETPRLHQLSTNTKQPPFLSSIQPSLPIEEPEEPKPSPLPIEPIYYDHIECFENFVQHFGERLDTTNYLTFQNSKKVVFYKLQNSDDVGCNISTRIWVADDLHVKVFLENTEILSVDLDVLPSNMKITKWSQLSHILTKYRKICSEEIE